jgi:hypothetical protein
MARHHKKTRKTRRRRMHGGGWLDPRTWEIWGKPAQVAANGAADTVKKTAEAVKPLAPPSDQAAALGISPGGTGSTGAPVLGPDAATPLTTPTGGRRRRTRKTRRRH